MSRHEPRDLFPGALEIMVLRVLQREPLHGYALVQRIQQASSDLLRVEEGSLYPTLQRLLKAGLLRAEWGVSSTNRRVRTYYLTRAGRKRLADMKAGWRAFAEKIDRLMAASETSGS